MGDTGRDVVDIEAVKSEAIAQGIALQQIALLYVGLDETEKNTLKALNLHKIETEIIATFTASGEALFASKITGAQYLAAD